jgi:hypothetical protein
MKTFSSKIDVSVFVKEFNFSFDEVILVVGEKMKKGGVAALLEFIFAWTSKVLCSQYADLILPKMKSTVNRLRTPSGQCFKFWDIKAIH